MAVVRVDYRIDDSEVDEATQSVNELNAANQRAKESTDDLGDASKESGQEIEGLSENIQDAASNINVMGVNVGQAVGGLKDATKATSLWGVALKALPIVAVAGALASLNTFFSRTKRGQDQLRASTAQLNAVFAEFADRAAGAVEKELNNLQKRIATIGLIVERVTKSITGQTSAIAEEARVAAILEKRLILTEDAERNLRVERAKANVEIEEQKLLAEDITQSFAVREEAARKALELETELLREEIKLGERFVQILKEQQALGENTNDDFEELAQAEINLANLRQTSATRQIELNNKLNQIRKDAVLDRQQELLTIEAITEAEVVSQDEITTALEAADKRRAELIEQDFERFKANEDNKTKIATQSSEDRLEIIANSFDIITDTLNSFAVKSKEIAIAQAIISAFEGANKAFAQGGVLGFITGAAIIAAGLANVQTIRQTDIPAFAEGVIDLQGPGTSKSDSIPARLSKGESVMTARETQDFLPTLKAMRTGSVDPELLNNISSGQPQVIDATRVIETSGTYLNFDENGFAQHIMGQQDRIIKKQRKYASGV